MEITRNPDFAAQIAVNVIVAMLMTEPKEPVFNPLQAIVGQMVQAHNEGREEEYDKTEN